MSKIILNDKIMFGREKLDLDYNFILLSTIFVDKKYKKIGREIKI